MDGTVVKLDENKRTFLVVQHPIPTSKDMGLSEMKELFLALNSLKEQTIMLYPNCDAGGKKLIDLIKKHEEENYLHIFKNLPHQDYLSLMKHSDAMIGNSSSGIIEAPSFKIPVIDIGDRQQGRSRTENIYNVEPKKDKIIRAVSYATKNKDFLRKVKACKNKFGDGKTAGKIVKILNKEA